MQITKEDIDSVAARLCFGFFAEQRYKEEIADQWYDTSPWAKIKWAMVARQVMEEMVSQQVMEEMESQCA